MKRGTPESRKTNIQQDQFSASAERLLGRTSRNRGCPPENFNGCIQGFRTAIKVPDDKGGGTFA